MSQTAAPKSGLILAVNAGSSSLKISLFRRDGARSSSGSGLPHDVVDLLLTSTITNISAPPALFSFSLASHGEGREAKKEPAQDIKDHASAFAHFLDYLKREASIDRAQIVHICHRVVHGGKVFSKPEIINDQVVEMIRDIIPLAPLHNPANVDGIEVARQILPDVPHVAVFDTGFFALIGEFKSSYRIARDDVKRRDRLAGTYLRRCIYARRGAR